MSKLYVYYTRNGVFESEKFNIIPFNSLHREDGPALYHPHDSGDVYYFNGKIHRDDGPAGILKSGPYDTRYFYYINHKNITKSVEDWISKNGLPDPLLWDNGIKMLFKLTWC